MKISAMNTLDAILQCGLRRFDGGAAVSSPAQPLLLLADGARYDIAVGSGVDVQLAVVHSAKGRTTLNIEVGEGASLTICDIYSAESDAETVVVQQAGSRCRITTVITASAKASYVMNLDGAQADSRLDAVYIASGSERCEIETVVRHNVADCRSDSTVKGVAGGSARGVFSGLVYVAPDAQHTDARQTSRNLLLGDTARIETRPQLEIYADDVKCSHGATVGQADDEAIFYMRQRGFSLAQARAALVEGFVARTVTDSGIEPIGDILLDAVKTKLESL